MRRTFLYVCLLVTVLVSAAACLDELRFYLRSEPKSFNPALVADDASETIRYLTGGVLVRLNRESQKLEPELAKAWTVSKDGRTITFTLRPGIRFSDGTPFSADDVKYTMDQLMDPALHSPTGDAFRSTTGKVVPVVSAPDKISITFPAPVAGLDKKRWLSWALTTCPTTSQAPTLSFGEIQTTGSTMRQGGNCPTSTP
jgi:peptide/nickel transport system substrate-binding protein